MPELPEVEAIKIQLNKFLAGHKIIKVIVNYPKIFEGDSKNIIGAKVKKVRRFAKILSIDLSNDYSVIVQIKMTGQLIYRGPNLHKAESLSHKVLGGLGGKHTHVIFNLDKGGVLYYNDVRKFGRVKVVTSEKVTSDKFVGKLGPEPLVTENSSGQANLTLDYFRKTLSKTSRAIKMVLMDQEKIAGVGNIYANDALWLAKINPRSTSSSLSSSQTRKLYDAIESVLKEGIKRGGASEQAFVTPDGTEGKYQEHTLAYGRKGLPCLRDCGGKIEKIKISGRGTYFCPDCQRL